MSKSVTLGLVVEKTREVPPAFRAEIVWGAIPWLAGFREASSWEEAVDALEERMHRYGYDWVSMIFFESVEAAKVERRRRDAAKELLDVLEEANAKLPEMLAGEGPLTEIDQMYLDALDSLMWAMRTVYCGLYDRVTGRELEREPEPDHEPTDPEAEEVRT